MKINLEVCVDNIESVKTCIEVGVDRLELCSSLSLGGLTPSVGLVKYAKENTGIPIHAMIRPRPGDFFYTQDEIDAMQEEIICMAGLGADGIVTGVLDEKFNVDKTALKQLADIAKEFKIEVTFHRAGDFCYDYRRMIETLIDCRVDRLLTSGRNDKAEEGVENIREMNDFAAGKLRIMAGSGINEKNVTGIIEGTGIIDIHCSASSVCNRFKDSSLRLGGTSSDLSYQITDRNKLIAVKSIITGLK